MVFSSLLFLFIYLPVVLLVYYIFPNKYRNYVLLVFNLIFYGWGEPVYIFLMLFSIVLNYISGVLVGKYVDISKKKAKAHLIINITLNLLLLGFFKYADLLISTFNSISGSCIPLLNIALPIGISFYTFQAMSYPIDIYRQDIKCQRNPFIFGTYISLFPQLIAGPIVRYKDVEKELIGRTHTKSQFVSGIERFAIGLGKKVLIANNIGKLWDIYSAGNIGDLTVLGSWLGIIGFTLQIYFDFSGYSDMAIGIGRMLGFEFLENFNYPYISKSITEFWRRWHISLSSWFKDYVYIPLGGSKCSTFKRARNIFVVWALTGIWHGASWNFMLWGLYYALFLVFEKNVLSKIKNKVPNFMKHIYTMVIVTCGWVIFQLGNVSDIVSYIGAMFGANSRIIESTDIYNLLNYLDILLIAAFLSTDILRKIWSRIPEKRQQILAPIGVVMVLVLSTAYLVDSTYNPFLYFRF